LKEFTSTQYGGSRVYCSTGFVSIIILLGRRRRASASKPVTRHLGYSILERDLKHLLVAWYATGNILVGTRTQAHVAVPL